MQNDRTSTTHRTNLYDLGLGRDINMIPTSRSVREKNGKPFVPWKTLLR